MTQCNSVNVTLSSSHLNILKAETKNETGATLKSSDSMISNSNDDSN